MSTPLLGLNFSPREALRLGLDPAESFQAVLIHIRPSCLRLSIYWDEAAPRAGEYDFTEIRWLLGQAEKRGCRVLLTVGFKPQRHPAYFPPRWLAPRGSGDGAISPAEGRLAANLLMMLERAIALLADYSAIDAWEVEHLPFLPSAQQPAAWSVGPKLLAREIDTIREVDSRHRPVVVSQLGVNLLRAGWRKAFVAGDILGCVLQAQEPSGGGAARVPQALAGWWRTWQLSLQAVLAERFGRALWVTELTPHAALTADRAAGAPWSLDRDVGLLFHAGVSRIYLAGVEEWLVMRGRGQAEQWDQARALLRSSADRLS